MLLIGKFKFFICYVVTILKHSVVNTRDSNRNTRHSEDTQEDLE